MNKIVFSLILFILILTPFYNAAAQSSVITEEEIKVFNTTGLPQWVKDLRRWDIIAFGTFPFSMFLASFFNDLYRWNKANGMDFSNEGRRYAPWPFKSAGAVDPTSREFRNDILLAVGFSVTLAFTDLLIVKIRQNKERRRIENKPPSGGTFTIERRTNEDAGNEEEEKTEAINDSANPDEIEVSEPAPE
jgi:hypothetical protein